MEASDKTIRVSHSQLWAELCGRESKALHRKCGLSVTTWRHVSALSGASCHKTTLPLVAPPAIMTPNSVGAQQSAVKHKPSTKVLEDRKSVV